MASSTEFLEGYYAGRKDGIYTLEQLAAALHNRADQMEKAGTKPEILELRRAANTVLAANLLVHPDNHALTTASTPDGPITARVV